MFQLYTKATLAHSSGQSLFTYFRLLPMSYAFCYKTAFFLYRFHRMYCKKNNYWTSYEVKEPKKYAYIHELMSAIIDHFIGMADPLTSPVVMTPSDPRKFKRTISKTSTPPTSLIMARKKSRYIDPD